MSSGAGHLPAAARARRQLEGARMRVRTVRGPVLQTACAAGIAWYVAHDLLGHAQPFFAPIAAAVSLSTSHVQRATRSVQMLFGVLLGIGVAELLHALVGNGAISIGLVVLATLLLAVALGVGFVGEGMMFVNQAAASAVLVIALHRAGTGSERAVDALVGGAVALVIGVGLFPANPVQVLWDAERSVLSALREMLSSRSMREDAAPSGASAADAASSGDARTSAREDERSLVASHDINRRLTALTQARRSARTAVRVAPRRMRMRPLVEREEQRAARVYLLANAVLSLMRARRDVRELGVPAPPECAAQIDALAHAIETLEHGARPWSSATVQEVGAGMRRLVLHPLSLESPGSAVLTIAIRRVADDVLRLLPDAPAGG